MFLKTSLASGWLGFPLWQNKSLSSVSPSSSEQHVFVLDHELHHQLLQPHVIQGCQGVHLRRLHERRTEDDPQVLGVHQIVLFEQRHPARSRDWWVNVGGGATPPVIQMLTSSGEPSGSAGSRSGLGEAGVNSHGWPPVWCQHLEFLRDISDDMIRIRGAVMGRDVPGRSETVLLAAWINLEYNSNVMTGMGRSLKYSFKAPAMMLMSA